MRLKKLLQFVKMYEKAERLHRLMGNDADNGLSDDWNDAYDQMYTMYDELTMAEQQWVNQRLPNWVN